MAKFTFVNIPFECCPVCGCPVRIQETNLGHPSVPGAWLQTKTFKCGYVYTLDTSTQELGGNRGDCRYAQYGGWDKMMADREVIREELSVYIGALETDPEFKQRLLELLDYA